MCLRPRRLCVPRVTDTNNLKGSSEEGFSPYVGGARACSCLRVSVLRLELSLGRTVFCWLHGTVLCPLPLPTHTTHTTAPRTLQLAPAFDISGVAPTRTVRPVAGGEKRRRPPPEDFSEVSGGVLHGSASVRGLLSLFFHFPSRRQPLP